MSKHASSSSTSYGAWALAAWLAALALFLIWLGWVLFSEKLWQLVQSGSCTQGNRPLILSKGTSRAVMPDMSLAACGNPASCSALSSARE